MGVGTPRDFFDAVERGVDLFDCVTPTRHGRNGQAFTSRGRINLRNGRWKDCDEVLDPDCMSPALEGFSIGVLSHLCRANEMLGGVLVTLHNLYFFHQLMERMRGAIQGGSLTELRKQVLSKCEGRV
jgi:queuine tRNA-ribosyltransferase